MLRVLKGLDMYGRPVGVHYNGEDSYKTLLGGFVTLVTQVLATCYLYQLSVQFVDKSA